jgi:signal transduction histidine kinase
VGDSAIIFDAAGQVAYPDTGVPARAEPAPQGPPASSSPASRPASSSPLSAPTTTPADPPGSMPAAASQPAVSLEQARFLEQSGNHAAAADAYAALAAGAATADDKATALVAQARCLSADGKMDQAVAVLTGPLAAGDCRDARDEPGRLIAPQGLLRALELMGGEDPRRAAAASDLARRLEDYDHQPMPSAQRLFLMIQLREQAGLECPTLPAERLAAGAVEEGLAAPVAGVLQPAGPVGLWMLASRDQRSAMLWTQGRLDQVLASFGPDPMLLPDARVSIHHGAAPAGGPEPLASIEAGDAMPDWRLAVYLDNPVILAAAVSRRRAMYQYTGAAGVLVIVALTVAAGAYLERQVRLARLKNDFIATVTHELKTPLASMRVLVDTLRQGRCPDPARQQEYFELIARENERLSRLIDNFLSFSRMERNKRAFDFAAVDVNEAARLAVEVMADRFAPPSKLEVQLADHLPAVPADRDALVTVILNLLDNAWKYSPPPRWARLRTRAGDGAVSIEVADRGIGLSRRSVRRIFGRFYQVDQTLSRRAGGCGLGLAIVKFILDAHGGSISVRSQLGKGSTFSVRLPAAGEARSAIRP